MEHATAAAGTTTIGGRMSLAAVIEFAMAVVTPTSSWRVAAASRAIDASV
jgi:hypothetical protein